MIDRLRHGFAFGLLVACLVSTPCIAENEEKNAVGVARELASRGSHEEALAAIENHLRRYPEDGAAELLAGQIHGWQKRYDVSEKILGKLLAKEPENTDIMIARGYMYFAAGKLEAAAQDFAVARVKQPANEEAKQGAEQVKAAIENREETKPRTWQLDTGFEYSAFTRSPQSDWNNQFLQIGRLFSQSKTMVHVALQRYRQFEKTDVQTEIGVDQGMTDYLYGNLYVSGTLNPVFRPRWYVASDATLRLWKGMTAPETGLTEQPLSLWTTLETRFSDYQDVSILGLNPGLRAEIGDGWALSGAMTASFQADVSPVYGWQVRGEGPLLSWCSWNLGYADAPETVSGQTVKTQTVFGGVNVMINQENSVRIGYARDDREKSYIRHAVNASISYRY